MITMLPTADVVTSVIFDGGVAEAFARGAVWAQMGTIGVAATTEAAARLGRVRPDVLFVDAPLLDRSGLDPATLTGADGRDLSGGEQRRLHIARASATMPDVRLIDEPTTGLDTATATATQVLAAIRRLP